MVGTTRPYNINIVYARGGFNEISRGSTQWLVQPAPTTSKIIHYHCYRTHYHQLPITNYQLPLNQANLALV